MSQQVTLKASRISKSFPGVKALQDVEIELHAGSIHALLGENGAGKSTLIKILTGVYQPDEGSVNLLGQPVRFSDTNEARQKGIAVVHQERHLIPRFSVGENLFLDRLGDQAWSWVDYPKLHEEAKPWLAAVGLDLDPETPVNQLSVAKMQLVEIAQAISQKSRVLLMDEPTASLTPHETEKLFSLLQKLKGVGVTIVFVSHKLEEVLQICDYLTVLRDGQNTCTSQPIAQYDRQDLVQLMIGRMEQIPAWQTREVNRQSPKLELRKVSTEVGHKDLDLQLYLGEILGFYGLIGAGRSELAKSLIGYSRMTKGEYLLDGKAI
ncbi:MAG: sugar ABC transporter ATP-binding protein, partial [SAR324 cluster bacterium]|nr:sugar ABC transporter ATP-binding protein [SAR324 cluster bacterium]